MTTEPIAHQLPVLDDAESRRVARALLELGKKPDILVHRVALIDGAPLPYDVWSPLPSDKGGAWKRLATQLDPAILQRPPRAIWNRLGRLDEGSGWSGCFYADGVLVGRVLLEDKGYSVARLRRVSARLAVALRPNTEPAQGRLQPSIIITDGAGEIVAHDIAWKIEPAFRACVRRLVTELAESGRCAGELFHRCHVLRAHLLRSRTPIWKIDVGTVEHVRLAADSVLTPTQRIVAGYAACGATVNEIAKTLPAARETVRAHLREIYRRLEVANRVELARALEHL